MRYDVKFIFLKSRVGGEVYDLQSRGCVVVCVCVGGVKAIAHVKKKQTNE